MAIETTEKPTPELISRLMSQISPVVDAFVDSLNDDEVNELFEWAKDSKQVIVEMQKAMFGRLQ
jgi:hypothetical protein